MSNPFRTVQSDALAALSAPKAAGYFADIPSTPEGIGDLPSFISKTLIQGATTVVTGGTKAGIGIIASVPKGRALNSSGREAVNVQVDVVLSVFENRVLNESTDGIGKFSLDVLFQMVRAVHGYRPSTRGFEPFELVDFQHESEGGIDALHVTFRTLRTVK